MMKRDAILKTVVSITVAAGILMTPSATFFAATPTSGVAAALGRNLERTLPATVASTDLVRSAVGELADPEAQAEETTAEAPGTELSTEALDTAAAEANTEIQETAALLQAGEVPVARATAAVAPEEAASVEAPASEAPAAPEAATAAPTTPEAEQETTTPETNTASAGVIGNLSAILENTVTETAEEQAQAEEPVEEEPVEIAGYTNLAIANVTDNLNIRSEAGEDASLAGKLPADAAAEILGVEGEWTKIRSGEVEGYVKSAFLLTGETARERAKELLTLTATVKGQGVNVREEPNTDCEIVDQVATGEEIPVIEELGDWVKVEMDGEERYVKAEFVEVGEQLRDALTLSEARYGEGVSDVRVAVVDYATQFVGNPYVWGGTSLTNGADCSGFVMSVMANYGVGLPHSSAAQANCGTRVGLDELKPGDLIFYGSGRRIGHVAIYIGNGQICHASNKRTGITVSNMYYRSPICATRVLS